MALRTSRNSVVRGAPAGIGGGNKGPTMAHCASVRSMLLIYASLHNSQAPNDFNVFMR